jgi:cardiolipin synthase
LFTIYSSGQPLDLETKGQLLGALTQLDDAGVLEQGLSVMFDNLLASGKLPPEAAAMKEKGIGLAVQSVRAEAWVLSRPGFHGWQNLADNIWPAANGSRVSSPDFARELELMARTEFVEGNTVDRLADGPAFIAEVEDFIKTSSGPLFMNYWGIYDDATGDHIKDLLLEAKARGVEVHIVVDGKTSLHHGGDRVLPELEAAGFDVVRWQLEAQPPVGNHIKFITDGREVITGGSNLGDVYTHMGDGAKWSDTNVKIRGPVARNYLELFDKLYRVGGGTQELGRPLGRPVGAQDGGERVALVETHAADDHNVLGAVLKTISGAERKLKLNQAYFIMTPPLEAALRDAIDRGVEIELITNSHTSVDEPVIAEAILESAKKLLEFAVEAGRPELVKVYLKQGDTLHDKSVIADDSVTLDMTYNLHPRSEWLEWEIATITLGEHTAGEHIEAFDRLKTEEAVLVTDPAVIELPPPGPDDFFRQVFRNVL